MTKRTTPMKHTRKQGLGLALAASIALGATAAWAQALRTLRYNGQTVSRSVRIIDGKPWVPLSDAARLVGGSAVRAGGGYEIQSGGDATTPAADGASPTPAGGANEIHGLRGTLGKMMFTGKWRLEVTSLDAVDSYDSKHQPTETVTPGGPGEQLMVAHCVVKNGVAQSRQLILRTQNSANTALTDDQGQSYPPKYFDFTGTSGYGPILLPGSAQTIALVFSVPKGTHLKDLVFSLASIEDNNPVDVRISLTP